MLRGSRAGVKPNARTIYNRYHITTRRARLVLSRDTQKRVMHFFSACILISGMGPPTPLVLRGAAFLSDTLSSFLSDTISIYVSDTISGASCVGRPGAALMSDANQIVSCVALEDTVLMYDTT